MDYFCPQCGHSMNRRSPRRPAPRLRWWEKWLLFLGHLTFGYLLVKIGLAFYSSWT